MDKTLATVANLDHIGQILEFARDFSVAQGCLRLSYHFTPVYEGPTSVETVVYAHGFSEEWLALYDRQDFREHDPIPDRTMRHGAVLSWNAALNMEPLSEKQQEYADAMREYGLMNGFGLPIFGPAGRHAYSSFDFDVPLKWLPEEKFAIVSAVARTAHLRICELLDGKRDVPGLSEREGEVLHWMAMGKSNTDIGTILDISPETVRTYTQRIYDKLGARDRIGAAITAMKLGLLRV